ncbi:MAG: phage tail tape measure C-terminal domain-containing protein [Pseudomonadota bacterium]
MTQNSWEPTEDFQALEEAAERTGSVMETVFRRVGTEIERALLQAAETGSLAFEDMAQRILRSVAMMALDRLTLDRINPTPGADATGFLPGDKPPSGRGERQGDRAAMAPIVNITIFVSGGDTVGGLRRSQSQIAAAVARAVARGSVKL